MSHKVIVDAEDTLMYYQRVLREIPAPMVPRQWVETLVETLEKVLDAHAELAVAFEPEEFDEEVQFLDPDFDDDDLPELEPDEDYDETDYESEAD